MNQVNLIGRLTKDPEVRYTPEQLAIARFTLAIDDGYGEKKRTNFIPIIVFGKTAENCEKYIAKGRQVAIEGKIQTGSFENKEGQKVYTTEVVANRVEFIGNKAENASSDGIPTGFQELGDEDMLF